VSEKVGGDQPSDAGLTTNSAWAQAQDALRSISIRFSPTTFADHPLSVHYSVSARKIIRAIVLSLQQCPTSCCQVSLSRSPVVLRPSLAVAHTRATARLGPVSSAHPSTKDLLVFSPLPLCGDLNNSFCLDLSALQVLSIPKVRPNPPSPNSIVLGTVTRLSPLQAVLSITVVDGVPLPPGEEFTGVIRVQDVRATEKDKVKIADCFRGGDVVKGLVVSTFVPNNVELLKCAFRSPSGMLVATMSRRLATTWV
jgi:hypothetical protein